MGGFMAALGSGVGQAAGGIASGLINNAGAKRRQKRQNKYNNQMAAYSYDMDRKMWDDQNKYNSPAQQMQRFKDAGLNPHLIFGQGDNGNAKQMPKYNTPQQTSNEWQPYNIQMPDVLGMYNNNRKTTAEVGATNAQTVLLLAQAKAQGKTNKFLDRQLEAAIQNSISGTALNVQKYRTEKYNTEIQKYQRNAAKNGSVLGQDFGNTFLKQLWEWIQPRWNSKPSITGPITWTD